MPVRLTVHPSADVLKAFGLGKLDDSSAGVVMNHLDQCADCCQVVASQSGDDFLNRLRQGHGRYSTVPPANVLSESVADPRPPQKQAPSSQTAIPNLPPELVGNSQYEILRELGCGGMGVVYLAKNKQMDRLEVLKVINKALLDRPGSAERFLREIRSAAKLSHANVVAAYSVPQLGGLLAFAMEYVEGQDLAAVVKAQGPLPVSHACYYAQQAALGLQHAFEKNMVHRDIKPQNLILMREGKKHIVKVLDFGLAKVMREKAEDSGLTGEGKMLGTPDYIAPEQTLDAASADIRADIYSLGCTLYYLLAGRPPFSAASLGAILMAHQMQEAKPLNLVRPEVPEELAAVVSKMMAKERAKRYQTPLQVAQALAGFIKPGAAAKSSPDLSVGIPKAAGVRTVKDGPAMPAAEGEQRKASVPEAPPPVAWDSVTESVLASPKPRKSGTVRKRRVPGMKPSARKKWFIGGGVAVGLLLVALLGMWAGGVFKVKTKNGTIVLENLPADAEVVVDGDTVTVTSSNVEAFSVSVAAGKKHQLQVKKKGFKVYSKKMEIDAGGQKSIVVSLEPESATGKSVAEVNGFVPLFNGKDLTGWSVDGGIAEQWSVEGDTIVGRSDQPLTRSYLLTDKEYANFVLRFDFKVEEGNHGVAIRAIKGEKMPLAGNLVFDHPLIKLMNPAIPVMDAKEPTGTTHWLKSADIHVKPSEILSLPRDAWQTMEVVVRGDRCTATIGNKQFVHVTLDRDAQNKEAFVPGLQRVQGKVGFETNTGTVRFRKIEIKELPPSTLGGTGFLDRVHKDLDGKESKYVLFVPHDYKGDKRYPVILFLHGAGERTGGMKQPVEVGIGTAIKKREKDFPCLVIFPQTRMNWEAGSDDARWALDILAEVEKEYTIDVKRVYLTGLSMGGVGTWGLAVAYPEKWAAIVPICGRGDSDKATTIKDIPCWCFHGDSDKAVNVEESRTMITALKKAGGDPKYTEYPGVGHDSWDMAYDTKELYDWLLKQHKQ